jgi:hypothetical protein
MVGNFPDDGITNLYTKTQIYRDAFVDMILCLWSVKDMSNKLRVVKEIKIERPPRAEVTEAQAVKRMKEFVEKRREKFISSIRENKDRSVSS